MHRRRSGVVVSRPFITVRTGTRRQRPVRKFLYGSSKTKRIAVNGQQCHVPIALQEAPSIRDESPMDIETGIQKEHQPSMHYKRKEKEVHDWQSVRDILVPSLIDSWSPCLNSCCSACDLPLKDKIFRCLDCSPNVNFCVSCVSVTHQKYILHIPEVWKCGTFLPYLPEIKTINTGHSPNCGISIHRKMCIRDSG
ncbi:uncharacterized protein LOC117108544 [Anneissia japonica]|uniref:uncharacterized protein LOC117108544 n=1 Tax=Anneissia japonica TaxID=1529436 RepID=UPI0014256349|nr:uncharacterized protein LOC117108544 [Anneissia japonica]